MGLTLNLGVADVPYTYGTQASTTGQVAGWLENRYNIMRIFYQENEQKIDDGLADAISGAVETFLQTGTPILPTSNLFASGTTKIEASFKEFLTLGVMETLGYPGVPTQAALEGVNHRLKAKKGARRPSFVDTGLYQSSFKAWIS